MKTRLNQTKTRRHAARVESSTGNITSPVADRSDDALSRPNAGRKGVRDAAVEGSASSKLPRAQVAKAPVAVKAPRKSKSLAAKHRVKSASPGMDHPAVVAPTIAEAELLDRARMRWQFGDWEGLAALDEHAIEDHPQRALLALLVGTAHQQLSNEASARSFVMLSSSWGGDKRLMARLLVASAYNTLARIAALRNQQARALHHFKASVDGVTGDANLACQARSVREVARLGLHQEAGSLITHQLQQSFIAIDRPAMPTDRPAICQLVSGPADEDMQSRMRILAVHCLARDDIHAAIDAAINVQSIRADGLFYFHLALYDEFKARGDSANAAHFLGKARNCANTHDSAQLSLLSKKLIASGRNEEAFDLLVAQAVDAVELSDKEKKSLITPYVTARQAAEEDRQHGHGLLLSFLRTHLASIEGQLEGRKAVLIEIGTTREDVPAQGSTRKIAEFCKAANVHFITVDMDPHNTEGAASVFRDMSVEFEAVNAKGEYFLREYPGFMDFVFLDAYDFDHGKHSELRQSRYIKFLGSAIDEVKCHEMHLDCAQSVQEKLSAFGVVCVDDTWLDDDKKWTAKGALAVPYLLDNGFVLIEARNRVALLQRKDATC